MQQRMDSTRQLSSKVLQHQHQLGNAYQLGALVERLPSNWFVEVALCVVGLGLCAVYMFLVIWYMVQHPGTSATFTLFPFGFLATFTCFSVIRVSSGRVYVYTDGFIVLTARRRQVFRWEEVEQFEEHSSRYKGFSLSLCPIQHINGQRARIYMRGLSAFCDRLRWEVSRVRQQKWQQEYQQRGEILIGALKIDKAGLHYRARLLPWEELGEVFALSGALRIRSIHEEQIDWLTIPREVMPDIRTVAKLIKSLRNDLTQRTASEGG